MPNTDTAILDEKSVAEIEARESVLHNDASLVVLTATERDALCQTVRTAWASVSTMQSEFHAYSQRVSTENAELRERLAQAEQERDALRDWQCSNCGALLTRDIVDGLQGHRRIEPDSNNEPIEVHCGPCEPIETITFRTRGIQLCRDKAAEWQGAEGVPTQELKTQCGKVTAAHELADELEKL